MLSEYLKILRSFYNKSVIFFEKSAINISKFFNNNLSRAIAFFVSTHKHDDIEEQKIMHESYGLIFHPYVFSYVRYLCFRKWHDVYLEGNASANIRIPYLDHESMWIPWIQLNLPKNLHDFVNWLRSQKWAKMWLFILKL